jgi:cobalt-zinc-cadmium efflux system membrane fusion protein
MTVSRNLLAAGAAIAVLGAGAGYLLATTLHPASPAERAEATSDHHSDEPHAESFIPLKPAEAPAAGVELAHVERGGGAELLLPGRVAPMANAQAAIGAPLDGVVVSLHMSVGAQLKRGAAIASIRSPDGAATHARMTAAKAALDLAEAIDRRDTALLDQGAIAKQQWETTRAATLKAQADMRSAEAELAALGSPDAAGVVIVRSTVAGDVVRISTSPGAVLNDGDEIALVADPARTELVFDAPPLAAAAIAIGAHIEGRTASGQIIEGEVTGIGPGYAGSGATVRARIAGASAPSGTVISGRVPSGGGGVLTVPSDAVQTLAGVPSVFVAEAEGFRAKPVIVGRSGGGRSEIIRGLNGDEQIAGRGAFLLKAELGKAQAEHED